MIGIILSVIFPGLGQLYNKQYWLGAAMLILGLTPLYPFILIWSIIDSVRYAKENQDSFTKKETKTMLIVGFVVIPIIFAGIVTLTFMLGKALSNNYWKPNKTNTELTEIRFAVEKYKNSKGEYPENLYEVIGNNPIRKDWQTDAWGNIYEYNLSDDGQKLEIRSSGKDQKFNTDDDLFK